ncbi:hypothetical protein NIES3974_14030 [Calothrix sp. NIES-3974]|nr:hypothetical protein NIES3974_14030 [Calothrix sp. NIES-3974]
MEGSRELGVGNWESAKNNQNPKLNYSLVSDKAVYTHEENPKSTDARSAVSRRVIQNLKSNHSSSQIP